MKIDANVIQFDKAKDTALKLRAEKANKQSESKDFSVKESAPYSNDIRLIPKTAQERISEVGEANALMSEVRLEMQLAPESVKNVHRDLNPDTVLSLLRES